MPADRHELLGSLTPEARHLIDLHDIDLSDDELLYVTTLSPESQFRCLDVKGRFGGTIGAELAGDKPRPKDADGVGPNSIENDGPSKPEDGTHPSGDDVDPSPARHRKMVRVSDLTPNSVNGTVFTSSLSDAAIDDLAADIDRHDLRQLIEVNERDHILDGERRWRSLMRRDPDREIEVVVVPGVTTPEQIDAYIYDAFASMRDASLGERVKVFDLGLRVLKARHGRPQGRSEQRSSDEDLWDAKTVRAAAARQAGFSSAETARRARKVLEEGDEELADALSTGDLSINAAYERLLLSKRHEKEEAAGSVPEANSGADDAVEAPAVQEGAPAPQENEPVPGNVAPNPFAASALEGDEPLVNEDDNTDTASMPTASEEEEDGGDVDEVADGYDELDEDEADEDEADTWDQLDALRRDLEDRFLVALQEDHGRAASWQEDLVESLAGMISTTRPDEEEADESWEEDDFDIDEAFLTSF